jgi:hypothetical protein
VSYGLYVLAGLLLCNCIPHLTAGLRGEPFPTPFSRPRGVGPSSPVVNALWGTANLAAGVFLIRRGMGLGFSAAPLVVLIAFSSGGVYLARHFGQVRRDV